MICCLFSGGITISSSFVSFSFSFSLFFDLPSEVILWAILFPIKSPVASALLSTILLPAVLQTHFLVFFVVSIFLPYLLVPTFVAVFINFLPYLSPYFLANDKKPYPFTYLLYVGSSEYFIFLLTCSNCECNIHIIFYFKWSIILICEPNFNE